MAEQQDLDHLMGQMYGLSRFMGDFINAVTVMVLGGRQTAIKMCKKISSNLPDGVLPKGSREEFGEGAKEAYRIMGRSDHLWPRIRCLTENRNRRLKQCHIVEQLDSAA